MHNDLLVGNPPFYTEIILAHRHEIPTEEIRDLKTTQEYTLGMSEETDPGE